MGKLAGLVIALLLLAGCGRQPGGGVSPGPVASAPRPSEGVSSPSSSASPVGATPSPAPPALGLQTQCRLPVQWWDSNTSAQNHAGFVTFPGGQLVEDPSAPAGQDSTVLFYDRALARWIFAARDQVSPDGREYAYADGEPLSGAGVPGKLHVVDVATGTDRVVYNSQVVPSVVQFTANGIYFTHNFGEGEEDGLWSIPPQGGQPRQVSSTIWEPRVANGAAWGLAFNAADPHPAPGGITHPYNTILRFDLSTGASVVWWYQPGNDMRLLDGDYSGNLFAYTFREDVDGSLSDWVIDSRGIAHRIGSANLGYLAAVDLNGVWFDDGQSPTLWLFAGGQLERIAEFSVAAIKIAGGCIPGS